MEHEPFLAAAEQLSGTIDEWFVLRVAETDNSDDLGHDASLIYNQPRLVSAAERRTSATGSRGRGTEGRETVSRVADPR
jgi:hypothetical protein